MTEKRMIKCAFNANHQMEVKRYSWHLARCPDKKLREESKLPIYVCKNNLYHIFLNRDAYMKHAKEC